MVFCRPNGIGVSRASNTTLNERGPDITLRMAFPVSFFSNLNKREPLSDNSFSKYNSLPLNWQLMLQITDSTVSNGGA